MGTCSRRKIRQRFPPAGAGQPGNEWRDKRLSRCASARRSSETPGTPKKGIGGHKSHPAVVFRGVVWGGSCATPP